jgi:hypothetical protein
MKKLTLATALVAATAACAAINANAYQFEVDGSVGYINPDFGDSGSNVAVGGKYYFNDVQDKGAPLAEAGFANKASNVAIKGNFADAGDNKTNTYAANIEYFVPDSEFYLGAGISQQDPDNSLDTTYYQAEVGYMPAPNLLLAVGAKGYNNDNTDGVDPTIRAKYLTKVAGHDVNLEAGASFGDLDEYNLAADYYIDKSFSLGADYYSNDISDQSEFGIKARKFINPQLSVDGRIGFGEVGVNDYNSFGVGASYRF